MTVWVLSERYDLNHDRALPETPSRRLTVSDMISWSTRSRGALSENVEKENTMIQPKIFRTLKVVMLLAICITCVDAKLLILPRSTVALVGDLTYLNCSTDDPDGKILWLKGEQYVYAGDTILNFDVKRFFVEFANKTGSCNLVIRNVTMEDAGSYSCKDVKDINNPGDAALTVLESGPLCQSNVKSDGLVGPNDCNVVPEVLNLSCIVTYYGNTPPTLQWKSVKDNTTAIINGGSCKEVFRNNTMKRGALECDQTVKAELHLHKSYFVCQTNSSAMGQYSCATDPIKVLYAFDSFHVTEKTVDEIVHCSANSTAHCNYKWLLNNTVIADESSNVTLHRPGFHRCEAMCNIRGSQCSVSAMLVHVNTVDTPNVLAIVFGVLFVLSVAALIISLVLYLRRSKDKRGGKKEENIEPKDHASNSPLLNNEAEEARSESEASRDNLLIIGLSDGLKITNEVLKMNLQNPSELYYVEEMPTAVPTESTAVVYQNIVYVVGTGTFTNEIWKSDSKSGWKKCASLTQGRRRHSAAFVDEVLYICGGFVDRDKSVLDSVEAYSAVDDTCKSVGKLVIPVQNSGNCVAYKKSLYIFGGSDKDKAISDVQFYDTVQNTCHLLSNPLPAAQGLLRAALWRESVILLGRRNCFIYHFSTETWQVRKQFKTDVLHFGLALSSDRIYVIGGGTSETDAEGKVIWTCRDDVRSVAIQEIVENKPAEWKENSKLPKPCFVNAFAVVRELTV